MQVSPEVTLWGKGKLTQDGSYTLTQKHLLPKHSD